MNIHAKAAATCLLLNIMPWLQPTVAQGSSLSAHYQQYQPIRYEGIDAFVDRGLEFAISLMGEPETLVNEVDLRISQTTVNNPRLPKGFAGTAARADKEGAFTIFLSRKPGNSAFHGQLAHEIAHLLNPHIYDVYIEGLNTLFAAKLLKREGLDWQQWERHFHTGGDPFYAESYLMMQELEAIVGEQALGRLLQHAVNSNPSGSRMHIDIGSWLATLEPAQRDKATETILSRAVKLEQARKTAHPGYAFNRPNAVY